MVQVQWNSSPCQPSLIPHKTLMMKESLKDREESSRTGSLLADPGCAECDELAQRADALKEENASLRAEVSRIKSEYEQLLSENASLKERLGEIPGQDDHRTGGRNEQHLGNDTKQTGQTGQAEHGQGGH
ncbi:bZIP transcription factor 68 [Vitis vinifera]|uniref:BZIP transcription factor 68 n=1 Tax=Vitis vinifera TaxID=29760 RepID=A0A438CBE6_VITVI|nr:bZIP transcription factor 68 [Vitis vinifera]